MTPRIGALRPSASISRRVKCGRKNPSFKRAARRSSPMTSTCIRSTYRRSPAVGRAGDRVRRERRGLQREEDAFARDRVDDAGGVADEVPAGSGDDQRGRSRAALNDGIGHEYGSRRAPRPMPRALDPAPGAGAQRGGVTPASACAQMPTAR